ncbi:MAG: hypothetical protein ABSG90_08780 [Dehalococcoidia bacterium]|jgi:hypothetical protein
MRQWIDFEHTRLFDNSGFLLLDAGSSNLQEEMWLLFVRQEKL